MKRYKYKVFRSYCDRVPNNDQELKELGEQGWLLVTVTNVELIDHRTATEWYFVKEIDDC